MIISLARRGQASRRRALFVAALACAFVLVFAASAYAAPGVTNAKFSNPVAYELKSLLSTRFTCDVNTSGTWGKLDIMGANGIVKTVYSGPLTAGTNWFPLWNGMDASGKRLPSASYDWRLTVTKAGESTVVRGKITVSKIHFIVKGTSVDLDASVQSRYMVPGNANIYLQASTTADYDWIKLEVESADGRFYAYSNEMTFDNTAVYKDTLYMRDSSATPYRGMHDFIVSGWENVTFYMTVIQ